MMMISRMITMKYMIARMMLSIKVYKCYTGGFRKRLFIHVNRILTDTASCEIKLGEKRSALFEKLKEAVDFSYGLQCMLKRRVYTTSGDSVPVKLSHDIHTLM